MKILLALLLITFSVQADFIQDMVRNPKVIIVHGEKAPQAEIDIAKDLYEALELANTGDLYDHIVVDTYAIKHQFIYANFNLIIVGTKESNKLCNFNAEIQTSFKGENTSPIRILPALNNTGANFFSARYGHYKNTAGIGYVRRMLNPFTLQAFNLAGKHFKAVPHAATFVTGTDSDGVSQAYAKMLDSQMLEGIIVPESELLDKNSRFRLSKKNTKGLASEFNKSFNLELGKKKLSYKGWVQGALADYAGLKTLTGVSAEQIFHIKLNDKKAGLFTYDDHQNTLLLMKFASEADSLKALKGLDREMRQNLTIQEKADFKLYYCGNSNYEFTIIRKGNILMIENLTKPWKDSFNKNAANILK